MKVVFSVLVLSLPVFYLRYKLKEVDRQSVALRIWCRASDAWMAWRDANPCIPPGCSPEARRIIIALMDAYREHVRLWNLHTDEEYLERLHELLTDYGPPPPGKLRRLPLIQRPAIRVVSFIMAPMTLCSDGQACRFPRGKTSRYVYRRYSLCAEKMYRLHTSSA